jgi:hypothetical protein
VDSQREHLTAARTDGEQADGIALAAVRRREQIAVRRPGDAAEPPCAADGRRDRPQRVRIEHVDLARAIGGCDAAPVGRIGERLDVEATPAPAQGAGRDLVELDPVRLVARDGDRGAVRRPGERRRATRIDRDGRELAASRDVEAPEPPTVG